MLIKVNSLIYKTKTNVEMKLKIKITYVLDKKYNKKLKHCWYMNRKKYL